MTRQDLLQDMKDSIGSKDPIIFFEKMVDVFNLLFDKIERLENIAKRNTLLTSLAIHWDASIAANLLSTQINLLRQQKDIYHQEISSLKEAYSKNIITQNYKDFTDFWIEILGWHPFLDSNPL